ncbi:MAG: hypothetical protein AB7F28_04010 [Candidatus Margulisiibacteriota bacterium]
MKTPQPPVSAENTAIVFLFGGRTYVETPERQQLFLGALKSLRSPEFGAWRGSVLVLTDHPKLVRNLLEANAALLPNLDLSLYTVKTVPLHAMGYKVVKTDIPSCMELENRSREIQGLSELHYALYVDVDIFTLCPVQGFIDYLTTHYRGEEFICFEQPNVPRQVLHGGLWCVHYKQSRRFLDQWRSAMHRCQWFRISLDQIALANVIESRGGRAQLSEFVHLLPFGDLYPYVLDGDDWRRGIFIHLNRRLWAGSPDEAVHQELLQALGLIAFHPIPPSWLSRAVITPFYRVLDRIDRNIAKLWQGFYYVRRKLGFSV